MSVSIHAPVRGATSTPDAMRKLIEFQSTLPCGERLNSGMLDEYIRSFNPRSRAGSDSATPKVLTDCILFQSTLPCGERRYFLVEAVDANGFQSTLPCGERRDI